MPEEKKKVYKFARGFRPASREDARKACLAIGERELPAPFNNVKPPHNQPIPRPTSDVDWLHLHPEPGQTFADYLKWNMPSFDPENLEICLQPVNLDMPSEMLTQIVAFSSVYLGSKVKLLPALEYDLKNMQKAEGGIPTDSEEYYWAELKSSSSSSSSSLNSNNKSKKSRTTSRVKKKRKTEVEIIDEKEHLTMSACLRVNPRNNYKQIRLDDVKTMIQEMVFPESKRPKTKTSGRGHGNKHRLVLALTSIDLFSEDRDLFLAGLAYMRTGIAVFSIARYDPFMTYGQDYWYQVKQRFQALISNYVISLYIYVSGDER